MNRIYKYNSNADGFYEPNGGTYLQQITAKDLYIQNIVVSENVNDIESFQITFPNIFKFYDNDAVKSSDKRFSDWTNNKFSLWQTQLNFATFCSTSACGISPEHLNSKYPLAKSVYRFHAYYHIRRIMKILEVTLPDQDGFNQYDSSFNNEKYLRLCQEYGVDKHFKNWKNQYYFSTYQSKVPEWGGTPGLRTFTNDSFSRWIIEKSSGLSTSGVEKLSESVRDYAYLILTSQASVRSTIIGKTGPALDAQLTFRNNFEDIINRRVNIAEDIKRFQNTLQYARSKVDYVVGENVYMLPSDMELQIGSVTNYNNKILVSASNFGMGSNLKVNLIKNKTDPKPDKSKTDKGVTPSHKTDTDTDGTKPDTGKTKPVVPTDEITHEEEKVALILFITTIFSVWWYL